MRFEPDNNPSDDGLGSHAEDLYEQLRGLARSFLGARRDSHTLQPTAVVHEAYVRVAGAEELSVQDRGHFFCLAARAMRHVLADHARSRRSLKRGGDWERVTLSGIGTSGAARAFDVADVADALDKLETLSERQARIVELRFFGGVPVDDIAGLLGVSDRTIRNEWRVARAWLKNELGDGLAERDET